MKPIERLIQSIKDLEIDRLAMQQAYFHECKETERLRKIIHRLKKNRP